MSVLDLFRNQSNNLIEEEDDEEQNNESIYNDNGEDLIYDENEEENLIELKDGNIENTCLFSYFKIDDVQGWNSFIAKEQYDNQWPSIKSNIKKEIKTFQKHSNK